MADTAAGSGSARSGRNPIGTGRAGPIRKALQGMLEDARRSGRMSSEDEFTGALAVKVAAVVDGAARDGDAGRMLQAINTLRDMVDTLPVRALRDPAGGDHDGADDEQPAAIRLLQSGPSLGDTADS